ncbi:MAG: polyprenol monophosphomannose synthase [Planctomycetes bacterium]|nr:polyprenol monophosphomannose synthase [Planctomycetota bacterium]
MRRVVLVPTYNERENLPAFAERLLGLDPPFDVLVIDDGSPDGTGQLADSVARTNPRLSVLHREKKEGLGRAYLAGFAWALSRGYDRIFHMDADFSHDPHALPRLSAALDGADLALGSRYIPGGSVAGWGPGRRALSGWGSFYSRLFLDLAIRDLTGGFKGYRREVLEALDFSRIGSRGYSFMIETTYRAVRAGFRVVEVPIRFVDRRAGKSKMNLGIALEAAWRVPAIRLGVV